MSAPLNPDARTECVDMLLEIMGYPRDELFEYPNRADDSREYISRAERTLDKILAVAQPVVNSVEELDQLPGGSIVKSGGREFYKTSYVELPWILPYGVDRFGSSYLAKHSKVTVIHRPEVKS